MTSSLFRTRRFLPLFLTQALGALNDNLFKNALVILAVYRSADGAPGLVALAGGCSSCPMPCSPPSPGSWRTAWTSPA